MQGQLLVVKDVQALEQGKPSFRSNKENREKYLLCWRVSIYRNL